MIDNKGRDRKIINAKVKKVEKGKPIGNTKVGEKNNGLKTIIGKDKK